MCDIHVHMLDNYGNKSRIFFSANLEAGIGPSLSARYSAKLNHFCLSFNYLPTTFKFFDSFSRPDSHSFFFTVGRTLCVRELIEEKKNRRQ